MNHVEHDMLRFLNKFTPVTPVTKIIEMELKDCDDEIGAIGEHYIVKCLINNGETKSCYVNKMAFKDYRGKVQPIIWD